MVNTPTHSHTHTHTYLLDLLLQLQPLAPVQVEGGGAGQYKQGVPGGGVRDGSVSGNGDAAPVLIGGVQQSATLLLCFVLLPHRPPPLRQHVGERRLEAAVGDGG